MTLVNKPLTVFENKKRIKFLSTILNTIKIKMDKNRLKMEGL